MTEEKKFYLTKEGLAKIKKDLKDLEKIRCSKIKGEAPNILHSEEINPEYLSFWEDTDFLQTRITELTHVMKNFELIKKPLKKEQTFVNLGATVAVEIDGEVDEFKIVGTLEADPSKRAISNESPIGKALLGKKVGERVVIKTPIINHSCKIIKIKYNKI